MGIEMTGTLAEVLTQAMAAQLLVWFLAWCAGGCIALVASVAYLQRYAPEGMDLRPDNTTSRLYGMDPNDPRVTVDQACKAAISDISLRE